MKRTVILAASTLACMLGGAVAFSAADHVPFGLACYWAVTTGTTTGYGDISPRSGSAHAVAIVVMLTSIPLMGATFASLTAVHVHRHNIRHLEQLARERRETRNEREDPQ